MDHDKVIEKSTALEKVLHYRFLALLATLVFFLDTGLWFMHGFGIADLYPLGAPQPTTFHKTLSVDLLLLWVTFFSAYLLVVAPLLTSLLYVAGIGLKVLDKGDDKKKNAPPPAGLERKSVFAARQCAIASRDSFTLSLVNRHNREREENYTNGVIGFALLLCISANFYVGVERNVQTITQWLILSSAQLSGGVKVFIGVVIFFVLGSIAMFAWEHINGDDESILVPNSTDPISTENKTT